MNMDRRSCINNECDNQEYFEIIDYKKKKNRLWYNTAKLLPKRNIC